VSPLPIEQILLVPHDRSWLRGKRILSRSLSSMSAGRYTIVRMIMARVQFQYSHVDERHEKRTIPTERPILVDEI
jgi:hypothetical protein